MCKFTFPLLTFDLSYFRAALTTDHQLLSKVTQL